MVATRHCTPICTNLHVLIMQSIEFSYFLVFTYIQIQVLIYTGNALRLFKILDKCRLFGIMSQHAFFGQNALPYHISVPYRLRSAVSGRVKNSFFYSYFLEITIQSIKLLKLTFFNLSFQYHALPYYCINLILDIKKKPYL